MSTTSNEYQVVLPETGQSREQSIQESMAYKFSDVNNLYSPQNGRSTYSI